MNFTNGLNMFLNDVYIWEIAQVFEKPLNYVGNDVELWELAQISREMT